MEQIVLNFDSHGFETFESANDYFAFAVAGVKDDKGRTMKQSYVAAEMDLSPSQLSHKLHQRNDTCITLNNAEKYTEAFDDISWIYFLVYKHIVKKRRNIDQLKKLREELDKQIAEAS